MATHEVPQPAPERMVEAAGHALVMGIVPGQPDLVARTAELWARAVGASALHCAYVDGSRFVVEEHPDGTVQHAPIDPDGMDDDWREREQRILTHLSTVLADSPVPWVFHYLAGRPDRALTHLARAVDASGFVIGTRAPHAGSRMRDFLEGSVAFRLTHHQHRPVLVVPLAVVDWRTALWR